MRHTTKVLVSILALTAICTALCSAQVHKDTTYGYRITPPNKWKESSRGGASGWIVGKFISEKKDYYNDPSGWTWYFKPEMTVVAFVHEVIRGKNVETEEDEEGETVSITFRNPYRDYKDFLKRTYYGGGYYFSKEEESTLKGVPVSCYEIKVEKLTRTGPRLIIAWVYHMEELDIAVQFEVLEESYTDYRNDIYKTLKSFRPIERDGPLPTGASGTSITSRLDWDKLSPEDRAAKRIEQEEKVHKETLEDLPKGWKKTKVGDILVLDSYNPKVAKELARHCQAIRKWLDEHLDFVGPDEYVRKPILKVYRAEDEWGIGIGFSGGFLDNIVIEYEHNPGWLREFNYEMVSRRVLELWFMDRNRDLYWALPHWADHGLQDLFKNSRCKGSKLQFPRDVRDNVQLKQALKKGQITPARELMMMGAEQFYSGGRKSDEASALVRYLLIGPGSKNKKTKTIFYDYLKNLMDVTREIEEEEEAAGPEEKPTTEEEEDEYFKRKQNGWKEKESRILEETFDRTFGGWSDKDWKSFESSYKRMIDD